MTRGEVLKKLLTGIEEVDELLLVVVNDDLDTIGAHEAIRIWEKLNEEIPGSTRKMDPPKEEQKPAPIKAVKGGKKKQLDDGKMLALRKAGWSFEKIADEMHCATQTVINHLNETKLVVDGKPVKAYPDNDGNLWYWHPKTGEKVSVG